jgi:hypothetical protein
LEREADSLLLFCHPERPRAYGGAKTKIRRVSRLCRFQLGMLGIQIQKVNFATQKRSFTCLASLDVQDDKSVSAVDQILCGGEVIKKPHLCKGRWCGEAATERL